MSRNDGDPGPTDQMLENNQRQIEGADPLPVLIDRYFLTRILFYALGTLTLVPANFFTTANDYWMYKFRDPSNEDYDSDNKTGMQSDFTTYYNIVANVSNIGFLVITVVFLVRFSIIKRLVSALCVTIIIFALTVIFVEVNTDSWQAGFFGFTLVTGAVLTAAGSVFMVTLFQMATKFPAGYLTSILSGQSICGIFASLVQIFSLGIGASSQISGMVYFLVGLFFVFLALLYFVATWHFSEFFKYYVKLEVKREKPKITKEILLGVLNKLKFYLIAMLIVLGTSIMLHPGVTSLVRSVNKGNGNEWSDTFFVPVATFLSYYVFDLVGRELSSKIHRPTNGIVLLILGIIRIILVPLIMLCNAHPRSHSSVAINSDTAYIIFIIIFAFTNGYLVNLCVIQVPVVTTAEEKGLAMILIVVFMIVGLGTCSLLTPVLKSAL